MISLKLLPFVLVYFCFVILFVWFFVEENTVIYSWNMTFISLGQKKNGSLFSAGLLDVC